MDTFSHIKHGYIKDRTAHTSPGFFFFLTGAFFFSYFVVVYFKLNTQALAEMTWSVFLVAGFIVLLFSFLNLEMAVLSMVFLVPITSYELPGLPVHITIGDAYLLVVTTAWGMRLMVKSGERILKAPWGRPIALFLFLSCVSLINSTDLATGITEILQTIEYFVAAMYLFYAVIRSPEDMGNALIALSLSSSLFSLLGIREYFLMGMGDTRIQSTFGHFNAFGVYLAMMIPLFFTLMLSEKERWRRTLFTTALVLCCFAILLTFSRGAWIGVLLALLLSGWLRGMKQFIKFFSVVVLALIVSTVLLPERFIGRAASATEIQDDSTQSRIKQYEMAMEIMAKYPLFGTGVGQVPLYASRRGTPGLTEIHNVFLHIGADRGIPAMLALLLIFFVHYRVISRRIFLSRSTYFRNMYITNISSMAAFLMVNMTAYQLVRGVGIFVGLFLGMAAALILMEDRLAESGELDEDLDEPDLLSRSPSLLQGLGETI